jgi:aquaporin Z
MAKYITELIGTFFLVLAIGLTGNPLAIGAALMVMVYMGGHTSGAHYNPAVTVAVWIRKKISLYDAGIYIVMQLIGAILAAMLVNWYAGGEHFTVGAGVTSESLEVVVAEMLFTFALALVVLNVATHPKTQGNSYYGLAIGFTVLAGAYAVGDISGGAFNPAVGLGPNMVDGFMAVNVGDALVWYLVAPVAGGAIAGLAYRLMNPDQFQG